MDMRPTPVEPKGARLNRRRRAAWTAAAACGGILAMAQPARAQEATAPASGGAAAAPAGSGQAQPAPVRPFAGTEQQPVGGIGPFGAIPPANFVRPEARPGGFLDPFFGGPPVNLGGTTPSRGYVVEPALTLRVLATDNSQIGDRRRDSEVVTTIAPQIRIAAETAALRGSFFYAPGVNFYANGTEDTRIDNRFLGAATLTVVPERVFVDFRALGNVTPIAPGFNDATIASSRRDGFTQNYFFTVSPYAIQRWGSAATSVIGYNFAYSRRDGTSTRLFPGGPEVSNDSELITHSGFAAVRSGEDLGRLVLEARISGTAYVGGGEITDGAERGLALLEARYAITPTVAVLGEVGYEHLRFGGIPPYRVDGMVWAFGLRLDPSPNTTITARYRRRDGFDSPSVEARIGLGQRTVAFASYSEQVTTALAQVSDLLSTVTVDEFGNAIGRDGAPIPQLDSGAFLGQQDGLFRSRRGTASISHQLPRDTFTLQYVFDRRTPLASAPGQFVFAQETQSVALLWRREIGPVTTGFGSVGYSWNRSDTLASQYDTLTARVGVVHSFSERLVGSLQYQFTERLRSEGGNAGAFAPRDTTQNTVIASVTTRF